MEEAPIVEEGRPKKEIGLCTQSLQVAQQKRDNQLSSNKRELIIQAQIETLDTKVQKMTKALLDPGA